MQHFKNPHPNATTDAIFMSYRLLLPDSTGSVVRIEAIYENIEQETADSMVFRNCVLMRSGETVIDTYITINPIGSSHGDDSIMVYRAAWISTCIREYWQRESKTKVCDTFIVLKVVDNPESIFILQEEIRRTMAVQGKHKNLLGIKAHFMDEPSGKFCVVMPFPDRSLRAVMKKAFPRGFPEDLILSALRSLLNAIGFLHTQHILHRDINAGHVYLGNTFGLIYDDHPEYKYEINLGFAATVYEDDDEMENTVAAPYLPMASMSNWAAAPEVYNENQPYSEKADIWLVGITALELAYGELKVPNRDALEAMIKEIHDKKTLPTKNYEDKQANTFKTTFKYYVKKLLPLFSSSSNGDELVPLCSSSYDEESMLPVCLSSSSIDDEDYCPFSETFTKMVMECLAWDPEERPSVDELLSHKFFRKNMSRLDGYYLHDAVMKKWPSSS